MKGLVFAAFFLVGCGGRVIAQELDEGATDDAATTVVDSSAPDLGTTSPPPPRDSGSTKPSADTAPPSVDLAACFGSIGKSTPSTLKDLIYEWATCTGGDPACFSTFTFNTGCRMELRAGSGTRTAMASAADCTLLREWSTSARLLQALVPTSKEAGACVATFSGKAERTIVGGTAFSMKTNFCPVEPFVTHRQCLGLVMQKYFPTK